MGVSWTMRDPLPKHGDTERGLTGTLYRYDAHEATAAVNFFRSRLRIPEGPRANERYVPPPYQEKLISALYGWRVSGSNRRRYLRALLGIPRGNLKSGLASGVGLRALVAEGLPMPRVTGAGTDRKNAAIIFSYGAASVRGEAALRKRLRVLDATKRIVLRPQYGSGLYEVIAADASHSHGGHPTHVIVDDLQAQPDRELIGVLRTSQVTHSDFMFLMLMTADFDPRNLSGIGREEWDHGLRVLEDPSLDEEYLPWMYWADPEADFEDPKVIEKVNPAAGISVQTSFILSELARAKTRPSLMPQILAHHFNVWPKDVLGSWLPLQAWDATAGMVDESKLKGRDCYVGVFASSVQDFAAVAYVFPPQKRAGRYEVVADVFLPEQQLARIEEETHTSFRSWVEDGWLTLTEGNARDDDAIAQSVERRQKQGFVIQQIAVNPRNASALMRSLDETGFDVVQVLPGSVAQMSPACSALEQLVMEKRIAHSGNRALRDMVRNLEVKRNAMGEMRPDQERSHGNISGPVASLMALSLIVGKEEEDVSWGQAS